MPQSEAPPISSPILDYLQTLHTRYASLQDGQIASYIPELATANPHWFGICIATTDGHVYEVGDTRLPFTIQSISKPLVYGLALEDQGCEPVLQKIGVEPTGDAFNSISLASESGRPLNPMINAGAIAATSLVAGHSDEDKLDRLLAIFSLYVGRPLSIDGVVYQSERTSGHRNRAIGHMLRNFDILTEDPEPVLDLYFQQCSISVTCRDLSIMAATLANGGDNPVTGERAVRPEYVNNILSVMTTCGMYDSAGEWVYRVGMPAKSGVSGGILAVLPGQLGIGVFSPPLDERGNSVRGVQVCEEVSRDLNLHFLNPPRASASAIRAQYSLSRIRSKRRRTHSEQQILEEQGERARVYELQGELVFSTVEVVVRAIVSVREAREFVIVDLKRVSQVDQTASWILVELVRTLAAQGTSLVFTHVQTQSRFVRFVEETFSREEGIRVRTFPDLDWALEWCENQLIAPYRAEQRALEALPLADHQLCQGLTQAAFTHLQNLVQHVTFNTGDFILRKGESAETLYLLTRGEVSIFVDLADGSLKRLSTVSPGMGFGESAFIEGGVRSADVRADQPVECYTLTRADFEGLTTTHAELKISLLQNLLRSVSRIAARMNEEVMLLER